MHCKKKQRLSLSCVSNPFYNNTKGFSHHVLITINACLTHFSLLSRGLFSDPCGCGWGAGAEGSENLSQESGILVFSVPVWFFCSTTFKVPSEVSKSQNCFNAKGAFCLAKWDAALREISIFSMAVGEETFQ